MKHVPAATLSCMLLAAAFSPAADATIAPVPNGQVVLYVEVPADATEIELPKFNPFYGELQSVRLSLECELDCALGVENTAASATMAAASLGARASLTLPGRSRPSLSVTPRLDVVDALSGYDGQMDFAGPSGFQLSGFSLSEQASAALELTPAELSSFVASSPGERARLSLSKRDVQAVEGGAGLSARLSAQGRVRVTVAYMFAPHS